MTRFLADSVSYYYYGGKETWYNGLLPWIIVGAVFAVVITIYIVQAIRSRGKPKIERRGTGLAGGFGGFGPMSRFGGGAGPFATPGPLQLYGREAGRKEPEDPRTR